MNRLIRVEVEDLLGRYGDSVLRFDLDKSADAWCETRPGRYREAA